MIGYGDYRELLTFVWGWYFPRGDYRCSLHMVFINKVKVSCDLLRGEGGALWLTGVEGTLGQNKGAQILN